MRKLSYLTFQILTGVLLSANAFADETESQLKAGLRAMPHGEWIKIQEERAEQAKSAEEQVAKVAAPKASSKLQAAKPQASASIHFTTHTGAFHNPMLVSAFGDVVEFEDGSIWSISSSDTYKTLNWLTSDLLVVTPNHDWFSSYMFKITNQNTGVAVRCNLDIKPVYNGLYTHWITAINYYTQEICLEDGSIWSVTGFDSSTFSGWQLNDTIIIGVNDGFLSSSKENILINAETLTYVRAHCSF